MFYFIDHTPPKGQGDWCGAIHKGACKVYSKDCEYNKDCYYKQLKRSEQENKELKKQHYEALKMLKHEYDGRQRDNEQWFTRCTENHNEDSKIIEKYRSALEEIEQYMKNASKAATEEEAHREFRKVVSKINEVLEK